MNNVTTKKFSLILLVLGFFLFAPKAHAAIVLVQSCTSGHNSATASCTVTNTVLGNQIVAVGYSGVSGATLTLSGCGLTWTQVFSDTASPNFTWDMWTATSTGGNCTLTQTIDANNYNLLNVLEVSGIGALDATPVEKRAACQTGCTTGSLTTNTNGDLVLLVGYVPSQQLTYSTFSNSYAIFQQQTFTTEAGGSGSNVDAYLVQATAGSTSPTYNLSAYSNGFADSLLIPFKAAASGPPDTTPPSVPTGLSATATSQSQINLSWTASTDPDNTANQISYNIYRGGAKIVTTSAGATTYSDTGLTASTNYSYTASAVDPAGNASAQSASANATTLAGGGGGGHIYTVKQAGGGDFTTIQACANVAVAGDTCMVSAGTYDERVNVTHSGTSDSSRMTFLADSSGAMPKVRGFTVSGNYIAIQGFEITNQGMSADFTDSIYINNGVARLTIQNNNIHDTFGQCIGNRSVNNGITFLQVLNNTASECGETNDIVPNKGSSDVPNNFTITAGVNDQIKFSVQGGPSQTVTVPAGSWNNSNYSTLTTSLNALMSGAAVDCGDSGNCTLHSTTSGPTSLTTLQSVATNAYVALGWTVGAGTMFGHSQFMGGPGSDALISGNTATYYNEFIALGSPNSRVVVRNNTMGINGRYSFDHHDGVLSAGNNQDILVEGNYAVDNNNADSRVPLGLYEETTDSHIIARYNWTYRSKGTGGFHRANATTGQGVYFYNNDVGVNGANYMGMYTGQVYTDSVAPNNCSKNNIWYNATVGDDPYDYHGTNIVVDHDLYCCGTGVPYGTNNINADPQFVSVSTGDYHLQPTSPARGAGTYLTTAIGSGSAAVSLTVNNANFFQDGWAGVNPDWIAVGSVGNAVQITSIDYTNNIITLASPLSWSAGAPIYLYKNSNGTQVLYGSAPDIGAYPYTAGSSDTTPPTVSITYPTNNATVSSTVSVSATASDNVGVTRVEFYLDNALQQTDFSSPYLWSWNTTLTSNGSHTLSAKAYDAAGNVGTSGNIGVTVSNDTTPPSVPQGLAQTGATTSSIALSWTASTDPDSQVAGYLVFRNTVQVANVNTTAFADTSLTASTTYAYTVSAYDPSGNQSNQSSPLQAGTLSLQNQTTTQSSTIPTIISFSANPGTITQGQASTLSWVVSGNPSPSLSISPTLGQVSGNATQVSPSQTTTYTLTAQNTQGSTSTQTTVTVNQQSSGGGGGGGGSGGGGGGGGGFYSGGSSGLGSQSSSTLTTLQALLQSLLAQLNALLQKLNTQLVSSLTRNLTIGSSGQDVKNLQIFLNDNGYPIAKTGAGSPGNEGTYFGTRTQQALQRFQAANNLKATGFFGPITRQYMVGRW